VNTNLNGRRALITGSIQGIGLAIAEALAAEGASIVLHGLGTVEQIDEARQKVLAAGAPTVQAMTHNLRHEEKVAALMLEVLTNGPLDILVNNAGIQRTAPIAEVDASLWNDIIAVNLSAAFHTMRAALPGMVSRGHGRVVNIASVHGLVASPNKAPYVSAKFGLLGLTRVAALEVASAGSRELGGVTVNCICPGWTETTLIEPQIMARAAAHGGDRDAGVRDLLREKQPSQRMSKPSEIGELVAWLCHPVAHNITGAAIPVDGGWTSQ